MQPGGSFFGRVACTLDAAKPCHVGVHFHNDELISLRFDESDALPVVPWTFTLEQAEELRDALDEAIMTAVNRRRF